MHHRLFWLGFVVVVVVGGCKVKNPDFCDDNPDQCKTPDAAAMKCEMSSDCTTGDLLVCKLPERECVQCTTAEHDGCTGTMPVCNPTTNTCVGCTKHADCASNACMPDSSCAAESEVLYVKSGGSGNACTKGAPCADILTALAALPARSIIRVEGTIMEAPVVFANRDATVLGDATAVLRISGPGDGITLDGTSKVRFFDTTIADALGFAGIRGRSTHTGSLELQRCTVTNNSAGIMYDGTGKFVLNRSLVNLNIVSGGVRITQNITFDITNNFIIRNGNSSNAEFGGLSVLNGSSNTARIEFNTIVDNAVMAGIRAGGLMCDFPYTAPNNLIARNIGFNFPNVGGICSTAGSLVLTDLAGLQLTNPDAPPFDYHLKLGSAGIDGAAGGAMLLTDFDGQARPNGAARDIGADEFYP